MASKKAFTFIPHGSIVQHFFIDSQNRVLGFNDPEEYKTNPAYFGANIGRVANRIANAKFTLNGKEYNLYANDGPSSLHGGKIGWDQKAWTLEKSEAVSDKEGGWLDVYSLTSENGDENYPGTVKCVVKYLQYKEKSGDSADGYKEVLEIEYEAQSVGDGADDTIMNLTNHSYFNLSPPSPTPSIEGTQVSLSSNIYLPVDQYNIPTNDPPAPYPNVSPDEPFTLSATEPKIDNCFIFKSYPSPIPLDTRSLESRLCARAYHPLTKLWLEVYSTEPAFQFYTGDGINVDARPDGSTKKTARAGFCVEPSRYVDAVNREDWKEQVVVPKGQVYGSRIVFKGWKGHELPNIPPNKPE